MKSKLFIFIAIFAMFLVSCSKEELLEEESNQVNLKAGYTVNISFSNAKQTISGFGGANIFSSELVNGSNWSNPQPALTTAEAQKVFGTSYDGSTIGLSILRIRVPTSSSHFYEQVNVSQVAANNGASVIASPWSPPASMKTNNSVIGGSLKTSSYQDYANHLNSFAGYLNNNGVTLAAISVQNEPDYSVSYESCDWTSSQMNTFLKNYTSGISVPIMVAESYNFNQSFTNTFLNDASTVNKFSYIAGHIYGGGLTDYALARQKGKQVWMTEHFVDNNADNWTGALNLAKEIHNCMVNNFSTYTFWYIRRYYGLIGDGTNGTTVGQITKRGYAMSQFSQLVRPGWWRVEATANPTSDVYVTAYNSGWYKTIVVINDKSTPVTLTYYMPYGMNYCNYEETTSATQNFEYTGYHFFQGSYNNTYFTATVPAKSIVSYTGY